MPPLESVAPTLATDTIYGHCQAFGKRPVSRAGAEFCKMFEASDDLDEFTEANANSGLPILERFSPFGWQPDRSRLLLTVSIV